MLRIYRDNWRIICSKKSKLLLFYAKLEPWLTPSDSPCLKMIKIDAKKNHPWENDALPLAEESVSVSRMQKPKNSGVEKKTEDDREII